MTTSKMSKEKMTAPDAGLPEEPSFISALRITGVGVNWCQDVLTYIDALRAEAERLRGDIEAYRGALGYAIPCSHDGKLADGTTPHCGLCAHVLQRAESAERREQATREGVVVPRGELWSLLRRVLEQGVAIQQDYAAGKYASYEEYAARMDEAARERVEVLIAAAPTEPGDK